MRASSVTRELYPGAGALRLRPAVDRPDL